MSARVAQKRVGGGNSPITISWNNIVDPELLADLLNPQMGHVCIQLLSSHGRRDGRGQVHQTSRLVIRRIAPAIALATLLGAIRVQLRLFRHGLGTATTLALVRRGSKVRCSIRVAAATTGAERDVIRTGAAGLIAPRHGWRVVVVLR
jgi:hypothetical protein